MAKKMIQPEKSWFVKIPAKLTEIIQKAGLAGTNEYAYKGIYGDINEVFMMQEGNKPYIRKSIIEKAFTRGYRLKSKLLSNVLSNKWLFYSQEIDMGTDALIQPVFDMNTMTEKKRKDLVKAIEKQDYNKLQKLSPNVVAQFSKYSCCLFNEEEVNTDSSDSFHNSLSSAPARDGSELITQETEKTVPTGKPVGKPVGEPIGEPTGKPTGQTTIISTGANENKRIGDKENKRFSQSKEENRNLSMEEETGLLSFSDKKTDYETDSGGSLEDYVNGLKLESKEVESLFDFAGDEAQFFLNNFDKFKLKFMNRAKLLGKDKELDGQSRNKKNLYLYNLLRKPAFRKELVKDIQECLVFKVQTEFRYHKEGYKWDLFNKDGDRMSQGDIIPRDAPPKPGPDFWWDFDYKMWRI